MIRAFCARMHISRCIRHATYNLHEYSVADLEEGDVEDVDDPLILNTKFDVWFHKSFWQLVWEREAITWQMIYVKWQVRIYKSHVGLLFNIKLLLVDQKLTRWKSVLTCRLVHAEMWIVSYQCVNRPRGKLYVFSWSDWLSCANYSATQTAIDLPQIFIQTGGSLLAEYCKVVHHSECIWW